MAQKALKTLAAKNAATLNTLHIVSLGVHLFFLLTTTFFFRRSRLAWFLISLPALLIEFWFERISRPTYVGQGDAKELRKAGEDLEAQGLTEWMWDVVYWTWGCVVVAAIAGNWVWWVYAAVPLYSIYKAWATFSGAKSGMSGLMGGGGAEGVSSGAQSKRQAKMEKRGGQKVTYR
ncbi:hypothetical protein ANO11243_038340 [Dothideomycetidae sp. 11243]|nr:hypothetical protein ANO11243_038340 [fungal sp. No.11243]